MAKRWHLVAAYSLIWLASSALVAVLYGADITAETISRNIFPIRLALVFGALTSAVLLSILLHLYFHKLKLLEERDQLLAEVRNDLAQVKTLRGLVSVCCYCRKVRNGKGYWEQIEAYVANNSHAQFTHGVCPECMARVETEICSLQVVNLKSHANVSLTSKASVTGGQTTLSSIRRTSRHLSRDVSTSLDMTRRSGHSELKRGISMAADKSRYRLNCIHAPP